LPSHKDNFIHKLPEAVFYEVVKQLASTSYAENVVPDWEEKMKIPARKYRVPSDSTVVAFSELRKGMENDASSLSFY